MATTEEQAISDLSDRHQRSEDYSFRLPSLPRIISHPPTLVNDLADFGTTGIIQPQGDPDLSFLNTLDFSGVVHISTVLDWTYENRRRAQMILPFLYLGPIVAAKDREFIQKEGITMLLGVRQRAPALQGAIRLAEELGIVAATIDAPDVQALSSSFSLARKLINRHLSEVNMLSKMDPSRRPVGKILVFCESGNDRSAAIVAAYLMEMLNNLDFLKAMQLCQAQRFCVNFDDNIKFSLKAYWDILSARRFVAYQYMSSAAVHQPHTNGATGYLTPSTDPPLNRKRSRQSIEGEDVDMKDEALDDVARFDGRGYKPFLN